MRGTETRRLRELLAAEHVGSFLRAIQWRSNVAGEATHLRPVRGARQVLSLIVETDSRGTQRAKDEVDSNEGRDAYTLLSVNLM